jgi:predicted AAA+ superfamily ATPase
MHIPGIHVTIRIMIPRFIEQTIFEQLTGLRKVFLILGARQVGKTTLLGAIQSRLAGSGKRIRYLNCELEEDRRAANTTSRALLDRLAAGMDAILLDEAQRLDDPGLTLKARCGRAHHPPGQLSRFRPGAGDRGDIENRFWAKPGF